MAQFPQHPARLAALMEGLKRFDGPACPEGHGTLRHVASGQCVTCNRIRSRTYHRPQVAAQARVPIYLHPDRIAALATGERHWRGPPCRHGHDGLRYTGEAAQCVECGKLRKTFRAKQA